MPPKLGHSNHFPPPPQDGLSIINSNISKSGSGALLGSTAAWLMCSRCSVLSSVGQVSLAITPAALILTVQGDSVCSDAVSARTEV
jgi:hypothetical protein